MTLDEIYQRAEKAKPDFNKKIIQFSEKWGATPVTVELKNKSRAIDKANALFGGNLFKIDDILRASIVVKTAEQVTAIFNDAEKNFDVINSYNRYHQAYHCSDGYFDARFYIKTNGVIAETQIHTRFMLDAKEKVHSLYEERQKIIRSTNKLTSDDRKKINEINKKMRIIFRGQNNERV